MILITLNELSAVQHQQPDDVFLYKQDGEEEGDEDDDEDGESDTKVS